MSDETKETTQATPTLDDRVSALEAHATAPAPVLPDGFESFMAKFHAYEPMLEELATVADKANQQGHGLTSILGAVGQQLLGIFLR